MKESYEEKPKSNDKKMNANGGFVKEGQTGETEDSLASSQVKNYQHLSSERQHFRPCCAGDLLVTPSPSRVSPFGMCV